MDSTGTVAERLAAHLRAGTRLDLLAGTAEGELLDADTMHGWGDGCVGALFVTGFTGIVRRT
ncbi:hypothetical protein [Pseudonocardia humida]|uniref:Uncharacterized protein n=1 Tax=Pseudonocardia humida TaxID=2800819 RepID=A0ABT1A1V1_9PSEU|nr:hypothetical protein [Pseudonocardia humida]MCO1656980.1 hypothetical protein [Pseudonocardia humida]